MGQKAYPSRSHPDLTRMNSWAKRVMNLGELEKLCLKHTNGVDSAQLQEHEGKRDTPFYTMLDTEHYLERYWSLRILVLHQTSS